jgi:hypothetical protein
LYIETEVRLNPALYIASPLGGNKKYSMKQFIAISLFILILGCKDEKSIFTISNIKKPYFNGTINNRHINIESNNLYGPIFLESTTCYTQVDRDAVLGYEFTFKLDTFMLRLNFYYKDTLIFFNNLNLQDDYYFKKSFIKMKSIFEKSNWPILPDTFHNSSQLLEFDVEKGVELIYGDFKFSNVWNVASDDIITSNPIIKVGIINTDLNEIYIKNNNQVEKKDSAIFIEGQFDCKFHLGDTDDTITMKNMKFGLIFHRLKKDNYIIE